MSGISREELERRTRPELHPVLDFQIPDDWVRKYYTRGEEIAEVYFWYRNSKNDIVGISYWDSSQTYQTWMYTWSDEQYSTVQEAIERVKLLMTAVARNAHWSDIASVRNEEYGMSLLDRHGIGKGIVSRLTDAFGTLQKLQEVSIEDIEAAPGIGSDKAWLIISHLHPDVRHHELWDPSEERWVDLYRVPKEVIDQCVRTRTYLTQTIRNKYRLTQKEIKERGLVKVRI